MLSEANECSANERSSEHMPGGTGVRTGFADAQTFPPKF